MLVSILLFILSLIVLFLGIFLWLHRKKPFLIFHPEKVSGLTKFLSLWSWVLILLGLATLSCLFSSNTLLIAFVLIADALAVSFISFLMLAYLH
ncbi:hypothetical protein [Ligilactobacillus sp. Marseille-Q7487]|uniref:hypothetical protein n=1 Tax=Ligilactobacillus sp. Marseille-Q7487 TaxID=3022128 RepID=UPI0024A7B525|nr:hypothetical protein [Ligilactobacillus sp. Marseille-Q7487]